MTKGEREEERRQLHRLGQSAAGPEDTNRPTSVSLGADAPILERHAGEGEPHELPRTRRKGQDVRADRHMDDGMNSPWD